MRVCRFGACSHKPLLCGFLELRLRGELWQEVWNRGPLGVGATLVARWLPICVLLGFGLNLLPGPLRRPILVGIKHGSGVGCPLVAHMRTHNKNSNENSNKNCNNSTNKNSNKNSNRNSNSNDNSNKK